MELLEKISEGNSCRIYVVVNGDIICSHYIEKGWVEIENNSACIYEGDFEVTIDDTNKIERVEYDEIMDVTVWRVRIGKETSIELFV